MIFEPTWVALMPAATPKLWSAERHLRFPARSPAEGTLRRTKNG